MDNNKLPLYFFYIILFLFLSNILSFWPALIIVIIVSGMANDKWNVGLGTNKMGSTMDVVSTKEEPAPTVDDKIDRIKMDMPYFNKEKFLDVVRLKMVNLYKALKNEDDLFLDNIVDSGYLSELKGNKLELFEFGEVDFLTIHGRRIVEYRKKDGYSEIEVMLNAVHIDYMNNNIVDYHPSKKKYIEDRYILTLKSSSYLVTNENQNKCDRCGATMQKERGMSIYRCEYCGNTKFIEYEDWKISNIKRVK